MSQLQLDIAFYLMLSCTALTAVMLLNKAGRLLAKVNQVAFRNSRKMAHEVKKTRSELAISEPPTTAVPVIHQEEPSVFNDDELDIAGQYPDLDNQLVDALKTEMMKAPDFTETSISEIKPDQRLLPGLAKSIPTVFNNNKPMASLKLVSTRIINAPATLTDEAIHLLESPAHERYPVKRFPHRQKSKRREAMKAFVENLPRTAAM